MNLKTFPKDTKVITLPRGGYLIDTSIGYVQIGSPPETVKDTMLYEKGVPRIFCLPKNFFHRDKGISVAEIEFPLYYNFFINKKKIVIICLEEHRSLFERVVKESLFGPDEINLKNDYPNESFHLIPNLKAEMDSFVNFRFEDVIEFKTFNKSKSVVVDGCKISYFNDKYEIVDPADSKNPIVVSGEVEYKVNFDLGHLSNKVFTPPPFGVTCLGYSHGFDPKSNTSGFILWFNGSGVIIDPPVNSIEWLQKSNVNSKLIDSIILTHTHADHDAGTFQKILLEDKIKIYTTNTIMDSWINKYSILAGVSRKEFTSLFDFHPVLIGSKISIHNVFFKFFYTLHSVPTIGFSFRYREKLFAYSSDHLNYPVKFNELLEKGIISKERYKELNSFPFEEADVIYHESGIPPLHTPIDYLNSLPEKIQKKIIIYHIPKKEFPKKTNLSLAKFGINASYIINVGENEFQKVYNILDIFSKVDFLKNFSIEQLKEVVSFLKRENIKKGEQIIKKGSLGDRFYIIVSGLIRVVGEGGNHEAEQKRFGNYQYFGETSILLNKPRTADIYAETDIESFTINKVSFLELIKGTSIEKKLLQLALNRDKDSWNTLKATNFFHKLTAVQKTELEVLLKRFKVNERTSLIKKEGSLKDIYFFHSGEVIQRDKNGYFSDFKMGDFIGRYRDFNLNLPSSVECVVKPNTLLFKIQGEAFRGFLKAYPGVYLRFFQSFE